MGGVSFAPVHGFPRYTVCSDGTLYGWKHAAALNPKVTKWGYREVVLTDRGRRRYCKIHTIVLEAFVCPRPDGLEAAHMDGNPANNDVSNLAWVTHAENIAHKERHGTKVVGERHHLAVLSEPKVRELRRRYAAGESAQSMAAEFGVSRHSAWRAATGQSWKHVT
ncbi:HNH endonuclease [Streptomyces sp. EN16]|uniref:HNH endonuclease n=1 Tax=Streptomyces sp. EN16 TaxID=212773 RepID=UPI0009A06FD9|nr:HNH endonuclease [Streptomyces sp. EN16]